MVVRNPKSSAEFAWDLEREEVFMDPLGGGSYDIREAKRIIVATPREVKQWPTTGGYLDYLQDAVEGAKQKPGIDPALVDDELPLIATSERDGGIIIDGHHRLKKRLDRRATNVPVVILTGEETERVRSRRV